VAVEIAVGREPQSDVVARRGGGSHVKISDERESLSLDALGKGVPVDAPDIVRERGLNVVSSADETLAELILHTVGCRGGLGRQEQPPHRQDTEQDGEQAGTQVQELPSTYHVHSPSLQVGAAFTATDVCSTPGLAALRSKKSPIRRSRRSNRVSQDLCAALRELESWPFAGQSSAGYND